MVNKERIDILDSFRFIGILSIMLYHYYSLWIPIHPLNISLYPYGNSYNYFNYCYLGVEFFFILSGFMIFYSLSGAKNISTFWIKKMIRLFPPLLICSIITYVTFRLIDSNTILSESHSIKNLLLSLTFVSPNIINQLFNTHIEYISGSYWFLWVEIQFYIIASFVYFINPKKFIRNYTIFSVFISTLNYLIFRIIVNIHTTNRLNIHIHDYYLNQYKFLNQSINIVRFNFLFLIGIFLFVLYDNRNKISTVIFLGVAVLIEVYLESFGWDSSEKWIIFFIITLLLAFIYFPKYIQWIAFKPLVSVGIASYSLYLIHEHIGVLLINKYANYFGKFNYLFPVILIIFFMYACYLSYIYIEKPLTNYLKLHLLNRDTK